MRFLRSVVPALVAVLALRAAPVEAQAVTTVKIATVAPEGTPWAVGLKEFEKQVEAGSGGKIDVRVFMNGVLGDENETVQQCARGQIQGVGASTGALGTLVPDLNVLELPRLFRTAEEADYILDTVALATFEKAFAAKGLTLGFWSENGYRSFGTRYGFVKSPADLKGHKMRSQESPVHLEMYRAFGASPTPIPITEVLTSMQTGVIDGYDNTPLFAMAAQLTSATKYFTVTQHIYQPAAIVYNKAFFDPLPQDQKDLLLSARKGLMQRMRKEIRALDPILLQNFSAMKVQVYTPTAAELATFDAPAKAARDAYLAKASPGEKAVFAQITKGLETYRVGKK
jgi:tripartite ATP-independent transporter DctP family solute receptor